MKTVDMEKRLLIIDDEENMRHMLGAMLSRSGFALSFAENGEQALQTVKDCAFDFILCDIRMPGIDGMDFLKIAHQYIADSTVIMMSAYGSIDLAIEAIQEGAYDFISKPFKRDEVLLTLKKAEEREALRKENRLLKRKIEELRDDSTGVRLIGNSEPMLRVFELVERVAQYDTSVLITGESGTGKELIARMLHNKSPRNAKEFVAINCGAIPRSLIESELFGHEKGAFTGAERKKRGLFELADNSTLFLDEIAELPIDMQVKLLRVLQEGEVRPVGSSVTNKINVRIVAATAKILDQEVSEERFRQDLLYRLNVVEVHLPTLRERGEDIPKLAQFFLEKFSRKFERSVRAYSREALAALHRYNWPGNVRELENCVEHAVVCADGGKIHLDHLPLKIKSFILRGDATPSLADGFSIREGKASLEKTLIGKALNHTKGNKSRASELLEISYPSLLQKIKLYGLDTNSASMNNNAEK